MSDQRVALAEIRPFRDLQPATLDALIAEFRRRDLATGELLFREGDPGDSVFLVASGELEVRKRADDGTETLLRVMVAAR
jgi:CRP-like cAMP-binding protein